MKKILIVGFLLIMSIYVAAFEPHFVKDPAVSPDASEVTFVYRGDLWKVAIEGGLASRLTDTDSGISSPKYSPDGQTIAFNYYKDGYNAVYTIPAIGGEITKVSGAGLGLLTWFPDGENILANKYSPRLGSAFYKVSLDESRDVEITPIGGSFPSISQDGNSIIYSDRGDPYREAYRGSTDGELWKYDIKQDKYEKLTDNELTERYPELSKVYPERLYYAKSDGQVFQLFRVNNFDFNNEEQLTDFPTWSVRDISIAQVKDIIAFEKFDEIWIYDDKPERGDKLRKLDIDIRENQDVNSMIRRYVTNGFADFEVSPNDDFVIFNYEYDLFMMPAAGGPVKQITYNQVPYEGIRILSDNKTVVVNGRERGEGKIFKFTIDNPQEIEKIAWSEDYSISGISKSPAGNYIIDYYIDRDRRHIAIADSTFTYFTPIDFNKYDVTEYADRINSRYIAYVEFDMEKRVTYLYLRDTIIQESYLLYNSYKSIYNLTWGKDDKSLFFTESGDIRRIDLRPFDKLADYQDPWEKLLNSSDQVEEKKETGDKLPKDYPELDIDLPGVESRITTIVSHPGYNYILSVVNDSTIYYANSNGSTNLYKSNYQGQNEEKLTTINDRTYFSYNDKSSTYYYNDGSKLNSYNLKTRASGEIKNSFFYEFDLKNLRQQVFKEVWGVFGLSFYDPQMHGVDWDELYEKYEPYLQYCYDEEVLSNIVDEMIGEVNASHTGFSPKYYDSRFSYQIGYIGVEFDLSERLNKGVKLRRLYDGTSLKDYYKLEEGDLILAINDQEITPDVDIYPLFFNIVNRKVKLRVKKQKEEAFDVWIEGFDWSRNYDLEYNDWVNRRREIVNEISDGKLAYLHIRRMNNTAYKKFLEDFWNDNIKKDGFIIDVRGNGGGNISEELVEAIRKRPLSISSYRGWGFRKMKTPARYYDKPIVVLIDEDSFSDAEVFPHLMQEQKLGTIIGMPTSGSVIGTFDIDLFDGSSLRLPRSGWWTLSGTNMEGNGVQPDIRVELTPEDMINDNDRQLKTAIQYLLDK